MSANETSSTAGFTLLELLAALAIAGLTLWIAVPLLKGTNKARVLQDATSVLVNKLDQTRTRAMTTGKPSSFRVDADTRTYQSDNEMATSLPQGLIIDTADSPPLVVFHPDGTATAAHFALRNGRSSARIGVDWLTGRASVTFER